MPSKPEQELIQVVSPENQWIGLKPRELVHRTGLWHRGCHVLLFNQEGQLLVQQRSQHQDTFPLALDCSVSEHLKPGETYLDGALRGLKEELGLENILLKRLILFRMSYGPGDNMINQLFRGAIAQEVIQPDLNEIHHIFYASLPDLENFFQTGEFEFSSWFREILYWYIDKPSELEIL